jgi:hypothetical protein
VCYGGVGGGAYLGGGMKKSNIFEGGVKAYTYQIPVLKAIFKDRCISHCRKFHTRNNENTKKNLKTYPFRFPY